MSRAISRTLLVLLLILLLMSSNLSAGTRSCTAGFVSAGVCRSTSDVVYTLAISNVDPDAAGPRQSPAMMIADGFALLNNYQTPAACTNEMVSAGICSAGQIGSLVAITKAQFADLQVRAFIMQTLQRYVLRLRQAEAAVAAAGEPTPDVGN